MDGIGPVTVLLVEGNPLHRAPMRTFLESLGRYSVKIPDGPFHILLECEARAHRPSVLLLDMEWHAVDTVEFIREIRRRNPWLPILGMTERQVDLNGDTRLRGYSVGFLRKPFSPFQLQRSIEATLRSASGMVRRPGATFAPRLKVTGP
jgi:CheY-like chemotaxis protein